MPSPINPQDWFNDLLARGILHLQLLVVDALFGLVIRVEFFFRTDRGLTLDQPAVVALHATCLAIAGALLGPLWAFGCLSVIKRGVGLAGLTPGQLVFRLVAATSAAVTSREWMGWAIDLNNALAARLGGDLAAPAAGPRAIARLLGLDGARERAFLDALPTVGSAISRALQLAVLGDGALAATALAGLLLLLAAVVIALLALQCWLRIGLLILMIPLMPIFMALFVLPVTAGWAAMWLRWFFPAVFLQALQVAILALSHDWLRRAYGGEPAAGAMLVPLLMALSTLLLTLKAPALLELGYGHALDALGGVAGAGRAALGGVQAARTLRR